MTDPYTPMPSGADICTVCNTPRSDHEGRHHVFTLDGTLTATPPPAKPGTPAATTDHGLRIALLAAGVVTVEQLQDADDTVRAVRGEVILRKVPSEEG